MHNEAGWLAEDAHALQRQLPSDPPTPEGYDCDVLIVGSGYGGAVAAARLAGLKSAGRLLRVWVVERGREYLPGMFPTRTGELPGHVRLSAQDGKPPRGNDTALWDLRMGADVNVVLASGLGGGSLINAAVMEEPEDPVWSQGWPARIDGDRLAAAYHEVRTMLQAQPVPADRTFHKLAALQHLGDGLPGRPRVERCHIAVAFEPQATTGAGVPQQGCTACGDCATGCNWRAKNSLDVNYLALARRRGAKLYCGVLAQRFERQGAEGWKLHWRPMARALGWGDDARPIRTRRLIVCAGSLGSTELLQRSQGPQLRFSRALGSSFSTNGDMIAAATQLPIRTRICADETTPGNPPAGQPGRDVGPTITGMLRDGQGRGRFTVQEFSIPAALRPLLAEAAGSFAMLRSMERLDPGFHRPGQAMEDPLAPGDEAIARMMVYGLMGDDGAAGRLESVSPPQGELRWDGLIAVQWPQARHAELFRHQHDAMAGAYRSRARGWFVPNPLWRPLPDALASLLVPPAKNADQPEDSGVRGPVTTVHPLGGCPMADDAAHGVVDWAGRVFDGNLRAAGDGRHDGLVVLDGAIVPRALGINPALTIAALAEHAMPELTRSWGYDRGVQFDLKPLPTRPVWRVPEPRPRTETTAIRLREQLEGPIELQGQRYWAELLVHFAPIGDLTSFVQRLPRIAPIEQAVLRLYPDRGAQEDDPQWRAHRHVEVEPLWQVELVGEAHVLYRHRSDVLKRVRRGLRARNSTLRGLLSLWNKDQSLLANLRRARSAIAFASHLGEARGLDYRLRVDVPAAPASNGCPIDVGDRLIGRKLLDCSPGANPWRQLSEMELEWRPLAGRASGKPCGRLALDLRHLVREQSSLLELASQSDHATALTDVARLAMLCVRAALKIQLMSFRPPARPQRLPDRARRRPGALPGLDHERFERERPDGARLLLTRYRPKAEVPRGCPVLLIHGYTASGSTYAHPTIQPNLVQTLCAERREVWVVELRTSIAFPKAQGQDCSFEQVASDIRPVLEFVRSQAHAARVDVVAHCIGAAMFCRAVLHDASLHRWIGAVVLSQVGPIVRMSPANLMRGFVASYLAQYLGTATLDAAPDSAAATGSGLEGLLIDAVLASLPYPDRDRDRELGEAARAAELPDFRFVRHRIDAMLGRVMELSTQSPTAAATLDALDDLFGHARVKTLAQVIHYGRLSMLADSDGRNRELTHASLAGRMNFPVLLLHGRRSGVFDWRGSLHSYEWLRSAYASPAELAGSTDLHDDDKLHMGLGTPRQLCVFDKFGHQDCITGEAAPRLVYPVIGAFLRQWSPGRVG